ncbi:hypothetical protein B0H17DRAFT_1136492 [Mycena rosella]|uniref:Uncharacterized protein n=1 Tax=Mycena rosella TaxID=1033263 RepID=A0AAD7DE09_MYCRO|nr:hypothetical protein B0H17DRAFT_1136492 [Mycena rosella]
MGTFCPPDHTSFAVDHDSTIASPAEKMFDTNVIMLPDFLDKGVAVNIKRVLTNEVETEVEMRLFSPGPRTSEQMMTAWFIGVGVKISLAVFVDGDRKREDVAAVFVVWILTPVEAAALAEEDPTFKRKSSLNLFRLTQYGASNQFDMLPLAIPSLRVKLG